MLSDTGRTDSLWMLTSELRVPPSLAQDLRTEVCVIGAGIAGITTAYLVAKAGKRVVVLEDGAVGGGETGRTTAHLERARGRRTGNGDQSRKVKHFVGTAQPSAFCEEPQ